MTFGYEKIRMTDRYGWQQVQAMHPPPQVAQPIRLPVQPIPTQAPATQHHHHNNKHLIHLQH